MVNHIEGFERLISNDTAPHQGEGVVILTAAAGRCIIDVNNVIGLGAAKEYN